MISPADIGPYLDAVERSARRTFRFREEIAALMAAAASVTPGGSADGGFAELTFIAKFVVHASNILRRPGAGGSQETANLSAEFSSAVTRLEGLLRAITGAVASAELRARLEGTFLARDRAGLAALLALAEDLAAIKNYELDRAARN